MRIKKIEFENFRNYKDRGYVEFPTDGTVVVLYGPNGVGKTTLHQFFQWVIYGETHFNKTTSKEMYNLDFEKSIPYHQEFAVFGAIDFEHPGKSNSVEEYSLQRKWVYRKELKTSKLVQQSCRLLKKNDDNWENNNPEEITQIIEEILPRELSRYYFFDGESMIADLGTTGRESAQALRTALYRLFDLDVYENAIIHLGKQTQTSTVLGTLYGELSTLPDDEKTQEARTIYQTKAGEYSQLVHRVEKLQQAISGKEAEIQSLSERIGMATSKKDLEKRRTSEKEHIQTYTESIAKEKLSFGKTVMDVFPYLLIARVVEEAQLRINLKIEEQKLPRGLTKELVETLLAGNICLCGNPITENERSVLNRLLKMFPPDSYKYIYDQFKHKAQHLATDYDHGILEKHLHEVYRYIDAIDRSRKAIHDIDTTLKQGDDVDHLIEQRSDAEKALHILRNDLSEAEQKLGSKRAYFMRAKKNLDDLLEQADIAKTIRMQIEVLEEVKQHFEQKKLLATVEYSQKLQASIQSLLDQMLLGTRCVSVSQNFELSVKDGYGKEDKSEGQFAISTFAYIGGICDLLRQIPSLSDKEFPLVLDGPFSKLDAYHRQNVIDTIPAYAPQVILFSKDDIHNCFNSCDPVSEWTIYSNEDRHISHVVAGYDPEVFRTNEDRI